MLSQFKTKIFNKNLFCLMLYKLVSLTVPEMARINIYATGMACLLDFRGCTPCGDYMYLVGLYTTSMLVIVNISDSGLCCCVYM